MTVKLVEKAFGFNGVKIVEGSNQAIGEFYYGEETFRFVTGDYWTLSRLVNDKSEQTLEEAIKCLTVYKTENGVAIYLVINKDFLRELALKVCAGF